MSLSDLNRQKAAAEWSVRLDDDVVVLSLNL